MNIGDDIMEMYFKIGEVADMFDTSIRALRLYDKMDLFKPEHTDEQTGYRYYTADQLQLLNTILVFKGIGVKLIDIKELIKNGIKPEALIEILQKKQEYWENQIEIAKFNIENIEKIKAATSDKIKEIEKEHSECPNAYKMAKLVCLENLKIETLLSEVLWL
jgi:DNA-binding transcriptional MerR regulator